MEENIAKPIDPTQGGDEKTPSELEICQKQSDEYLNNWKRAAADLANYKKGEVERAGMLTGYVRESVIDNILPVLDSIYLAQQHMPPAFAQEGSGLRHDEASLRPGEVGEAKEEITNWMQGFSQIQNQIKDFLKKEGIETIETVGQKFDPTTMEIVGEVEGGESHAVAEELQKGYKIGDRVLRPAKVKVSK